MIKHLSRDAGKPKVWEFFCRICCLFVAPNNHLVWLTSEKPSILFVHSGVSEWAKCAAEEVAQRSRLWPPTFDWEPLWPNSARGKRKVVLLPHKGLGSNTRFGLVTHRLVFVVHNWSYLCVDDCIMRSCKSDNPKVREQIPRAPRSDLKNYLRRVREPIMVGDDQSSKSTYNGKKRKRRSSLKSNKEDINKSLAMNSPYTTQGPLWGTNMELVKSFRNEYDAARFGSAVRKSSFVFRSWKFLISLLNLKALTIYGYCGFTYNPSVFLVLKDL